MRVIGVTNGVHMPTWIGEEVDAPVGIDLSIATRVEINEKEDRPNLEGASKLMVKSLWNGDDRRKKMIELLRERLRVQL
jgi:hypothetical protein